MEWTIYDDRNQCAECGSRENLKRRRFTFTVTEETNSNVGRLEKGDYVTVHLSLCKECRR